REATSGCVERREAMTQSSVSRGIRPSPQPPSGRGSQEGVIVAESLRLGYGARTVLDRVNMCVREGELWFLLGPNGAGKSTLLSAILGRLAPMSGTIRRREDVQGARCIGFVPQRCDLNPSLPTTVREFVSLGLVGLPGAHKAAKERMGWALERSGL